MCFLSHIFLLSLYNWLEHLYCIAFGVFLGITFDAHPHSGWFFCLAPNGARRTESHINYSIAFNTKIEGICCLLILLVLKIRNSNNISDTKDQNFFSKFNIPQFLIQHPPISNSISPINPDLIE